MQPISPIKIVSVLNAILFQFGGYDEKTSVAQGKLLHNTTLTAREREERRERCDSGLLIVIWILTADDKNSCPSAHKKLDSLQGPKRERRVREIICI